MCVCVCVCVCVWQVKVLEKDVPDLLRLIVNKMEIIERHAYLQVPPPLPPAMPGGVSPGIPAAAECAPRRWCGGLIL